MPSKKKDSGRAAKPSKKTPPSLPAVSLDAESLETPRLRHWRFESTAKTHVTEMRDSSAFFDAHCFYLDWQQNTDGIDSLLAAMATGGVGMAAITGCPLKKAWSDTSEKPPEHYLYDDGDLYFYSLTDGMVYRDLQLAAKHKTLTAYSGLGTRMGGHRSFLPLLHTACGFNLADRSVGEDAARVAGEYQVHGLGVFYLQCDDVNNMTVKNGNWTHTAPAVAALLDAAAAHQPTPLPFLFVSDAASSSSKVGL